MRATGGRHFASERVQLDLLQAIDLMCRREREREAVFAQCERIAADPSVTACVAFNDDEAAACLDYMRLAGRRVPGDMAVVGFDDGLDALNRGLTSWNFNGAAHMRAMVGHIVRPRRGEGMAMPVEYDGFMTVRGIC